MSKSSIKKKLNFYILEIVCKYRYLRRLANTTYMKYYYVKYSFPEKLIFAIYYL